LLKRETIFLFFPKGFHIKEKYSSGLLRSNWEWIIEKEELRVENRESKMKESGTED